MGNTGRKVCLSSFAFPLNLTQSIIQSRQKVLLYGLWLLVPLVYWGDTALPTVSWVTWAQFRGSAQQHTSGSNRGEKKKKNLSFMSYHGIKQHDMIMSLWLSKFCTSACILETFITPVVQLPLTAVAHHLLWLLHTQQVYSWCPKLRD